MKSIRGIYYDLTESDYIIELEGFKFYFSSKLYMNKFKSSYEDYIKNETDKIKIAYNINVDLTNMLLIAYYKKIEKRGFFIKYYSALNDTWYNLDINKIINTTLL